MRQLRSCELGDSMAQSSDDTNRVTNFFRGIWGLKIHAVSSAVLAGLVTFFLNQRFPPHPITVPEFILLWLLMLIPTAAIISLWRRFK